MATFRLAVITIVDPVDPSFLAGDEVLVMWDGSTSAIIVTKNGSPFTTPGATLGQPDTNYRIVIGVSSYEGEYAISGYSFCSGTDLHWFRMITIFPEYPFFTKQITTNSPVCAVGGGAVCDIHFIGSPTITHASNLTDPDGQIIVEATSSNGTVKYGLTNFNYATGGQVSGTFTNLAHGIYTVYAKDANDCTTTKEFKVLFQADYSEHYRFSWGSAQTDRYSRVRIYEREYVGDLAEVDHGDESPFRLIKPKQEGINDKFFPIHPTSAVLSLMSEVDYQFLPLFTQDNKRYKAVYEVNEGLDFVETWQGFFDPNVYREDFESTPYTVEFQISDNVKTLEKELYTDDLGQLLNGSQKLIKVIAHVMKKTGLSLQIRSGINIFAVQHNTAATDDPLDQTYVDIACYRREGEPFTCWEVLEAILKPFGARIYQCNNQWQIEEIDRAVASYAYRVFDADGVYLSNGTFNPIIDIKGSSYQDRAAMVDEDHSMEIIPAYGKITITTQLNYVGSLIAGSFEKSDLLSPESEEENANTGVFVSEEGFKDWTLRQPPGISGVSFGRSVVLDEDKRFSFSRLRDAETAVREEFGRSVGTFHYSRAAWSGNLRDAYIESAAKPFQFAPGSEIKFSFEYSTPNTSRDMEFMVIRYAIKLGSNWLQPDLSWGATEAILRKYPKPSTNLQKIEFVAPCPSVNAVTDSTIQVRIYNYAVDFYDYGLPTKTSSPLDGTEGYTGLDGLVTAGIKYDYRLDIRQHSGFLAAAIRGFFELRISDAAEDIPGGIIRAGDFNAISNPKIFYLINSIFWDDDFNGGTRKFHIDNVSVDSLLNGQPAPETETRELQISKYVNENLEVTLYNADRATVVNAKNMYNNHFRLSDGTPTTIWQRSGITEFLPLKNILLKVLGSNHSAPTFRITGSFVNEFSRIGINNYLRLTKPGSSLSLSNTEFTTGLTGWIQAGAGTAFTWTADNAGSAQVVLSGAISSQKFYQEVSHKGGYIQISAEIGLIPGAANDREDILWTVFFRGSSIVHTEKLKTFTAPSLSLTQTITHTAFAPGHVTGIGFFFQNINGSSSCTYQVTKFLPLGTDIQEVYQISDYQFNDRHDEYILELMQISKTYISLSGIESGGTNQGGGTTGREHSSAYSSAYS